jgi:hypothetical protein
MINAYLQQISTANYTHVRWHRHGTARGNCHRVTHGFGSQPGLSLCRCTSIGDDPVTGGRSRRSMRKLRFALQSVKGHHDPTLRTSSEGTRSWEVPTTRLCEQQNQNDRPIIALLAHTTPPLSAAATGGRCMRSFRTANRHCSVRI